MCNVIKMNYLINGIRIESRPLLPSFIKKINLDVGVLKN